MSGELLNLFWVLASEDADERIQASKDLVDMLAKGQSSFQRDPNADDRWETRFHSDVVYCLKRLIRGLGSSRKGSRQGFSLALTSLLLNLGKDIISTDIYCTISDDISSASEKSNRQERKDYVFARTFHALVLCRSNRISDLSSDKLTSLILELCNFISSYPLLKEFIYVSIIEITQCISYKKMFKPTVYPLLISKEAGLFDDAKISDIEEFSPESLMLALALKERFESENDICIEFKSLIKSNHIISMTNALMLSADVYPRFHSVWKYLFDPLTRDKKINSNKLSKIWLMMIDENMCLPSSSMRKKYLAFQLFSYLLTRIGRIITKETQSSISILFSKNFLDSFVRELNYKKSQLHDIAKQCHSSIISISKVSDIAGLSIVYALTNYNKQFDLKCNIKTITPILQSISSKGIKAYAEETYSEFTSVLNDMNSNDRNNKLKYLIEHLCTMAQSINDNNNDNKWINIILNILFRISYYQPTDNKDITVSSDVITKAKIHFQSLLHHTLSTIEHKKRVALKANNETKSSSSKSTTPFSLNGSSCDIYNYWLKLNNNKTPLLKAYDDESKEIQLKAVNSLKKLQKLIKKLQKNINSSPASNTQLGRYIGLSLFIEHLLLYQLSDVEFITPLLDDITHVVSDVIDNNNNNENNKKYLNVLIDIILSLLMKPSALFREVIKIVFNFFIVDMDETSLKMLVNAVSDDDDDDDDDESEVEMMDDDDESEVEMMDDDNNNNISSDSDSNDDDNNNNNKRHRPNKLGEREPEKDIILNLDDLAKILKPDVKDEELSAFLDETEIQDFETERKAIKKLLATRANIKKEAKQAILNQQHFKQRVLDLIEMYIKYEAKNSKLIVLIEPLIKSISFQDTMTDINTMNKNAIIDNRLMSIISNKLCKTSPKLNNETEINNAIEILTNILETAKGGNVPRNTLVMLNNTCCYLIKILTPFFTTSQHVPTNERNNEQKEIGIKISKLYESVIESFLTNKKSGLNTRFFLDWSNVCSPLAWRCIGYIIGLLDSDKIQEENSQIEAMSLLNNIVKNRKVMHVDETLKSGCVSWDQSLMNVLKSTLSMIVKREKTMVDEEKLERKDKVFIKPKRFTLFVKELTKFIIKLKQLCPSDTVLKLSSSSIQELFETLSDNYIIGIKPSLIAYYREVNWKLPQRINELIPSKNANIVNNIKSKKRKEFTGKK